MRRYCREGHQGLIIDYLRQSSSFNDLEWMEKGCKGNVGTGIRRVIDALIMSGAGAQVATLSLAHLWRLLVGARYHAGLRADWKSWAQKPESFDDPEYKPALRSGIVSDFDKMHREIAAFGPFIETHGAEAEREKLHSIASELERTEARFPNL